MKKSVLIVIVAVVVAGLLVAAALILRSRSGAGRPVSVPPAPTAPSGTGGSASVPEVVPEVSGEPRCGDGVCNGFDNSRLCPVDCGPEIASMVFANDVGKDFILLNWETSVPTTATVHFGTTEDAADGSVESSTFGTSHEVRLTGLRAESMYHVRLTIREADGTETEITDYAFETSEN